MSMKTIIICAQALLIQTICCQCIRTFGAYDRFGYGFGYDGFAYGAPFATGPVGLAASHSPGLAITSTSRLNPSGVSVLSENAYNGALAIDGAVPFLGTVALEGALPTAGAGAIAYNCGNGAVAITGEDIVAYGYAGFPGPFGYGASYTGKAEPFGYGLGVARPLSLGRRWGCGAFY